MLRKPSNRRVQAAQPTGSGPPTLTILCYNGNLFRPRQPLLDDPVIVDLATMRRPEAPIAILLDAQEDAIVGQSRKVNIAPGHVVVRGIVTGNTGDEESPAGKVTLHARNGFIWKASMILDWTLNRSDYVVPGDLVTVNGREITGPAYVVKGAELVAVSLGATSSDRSSSVEVGSQQRGGMAALAAVVYREQRQKHNGKRGRIELVTCDSHATVRVLGDARSGSAGQPRLRLAASA